MASSIEAPAAAGPLGPFPPLPAGTRPEDVEIGRGMRRMLLALAQSQGAAGCGTEPMDELIASEGMETAAPTRQARHFEAGHPLAPQGPEGHPRHSAVGRTRCLHPWP